jgi:putative ABC transport system substrate-binding protein
MRRREFITFLGYAAAAWPLAARAQRADKTWKIGMIMGFPESDPQARPRANAFLAALKELGWNDGGNIKIEYRWAAGEAGRIRAAAADLVAQAPDIIVANGSEVTSAVKSYTRAIPIVFVQVSDPVGLGVVESLAHPGGNVTGLTHFEYSVSEKWLQLLKEIAPSVSRVTVLLNSANPAANGHYRAIEAVARPLAVQKRLADVKTAAEIEDAISSLTSEPNGGLIVLPDNVTLIHRDRIVAAAARHGLPAMYPYRYFVTAGGLVCYGVDVIDLFKRAAIYVDRIIKGTKPADLPVQGPIKFDWVINLKTAKALGLTIAPTVLARADEIID